MSYDCPVGLWILRKAAAATAYCGDLRIAEFKRLKLMDLKETSNTIWVECTPAKQWGEVKTSRFLIPRNLENSAKCFATHVTAHTDAVK